jgi:hypothetical protein
MKRNYQITATAQTKGQFWICTDGSASSLTRSAFIVPFHESKSWINLGENKQE